MSIFYFVAGTSGSGKTAIMPDLKKMLGATVDIYDFDDIGVPNGADKQWRQESTELWLQKLLNNGKDACLLGQIVLGEILACPSAKQLGPVNFCLLDVSDFERIKRLKKRNTYGADQNMLNWSAWLRMHHQDPQWMQSVLKEGFWDKLDFSVWDALENWDSKASVKELNTTDLSITQVAESIAEWIAGNHAHAEAIPNTPYQLYKNIPNAVKIIDEPLFAYNKQCVPATQTPEVIDMHYVVKQNNTVIAGICGYMYVWKIVHIDLLFVHEAHRNKDLATFLLQRVEKEAKAMGVKLVHLDTFDFQAKDFYLKQGYEIFGVLDDCPQGHQRYYLKKIL